MLNMDWYNRLNGYFPEHEMKDKGQMSDLIQEKDVYHKKETENFIVLYAEFEDFIFIDYLLVNPKTRGKGIGGKVLDWFKEKDKPIILEVEPVDQTDEDTEKRLLFYYKNGFKKADQIKYERENEEGESYRMNILYWSPERINQTDIMEFMAKACQEIHNFRAKKYYGRLVADPDEVLNWKH